MRHEALVNLMNDAAALTLAYATYVPAILNLSSVEYAIAAALVITPVMQHYLVKVGAFSYRGAVRVYVASMINLALSWVIIMEFLSISLGTQLPLILMPPFISIALAMGLGVRYSSTAPVTPLLLALPALMMSYSPMLIALYSLIPFTLAAVELAILKDTYGGYISISKTAPAAALTQYLLYIELRRMAMSSVSQATQLTLYLAALIALSMVFRRLNARRVHELASIIAVTAASSVFAELMPLTCAGLIMVTRMLLFY